MPNREKFLEDAIEKIRHLREMGDSLSASLQLINPDFNYFSFGRIESDYTWFLKEMFDDKDDWIGYFIYECDFGKKPMEVKLANGKTFKLRTTKQLYELLTQ